MCISMMYENNYEIALHGKCRLPDRTAGCRRAMAEHHRRRTRYPDQGRPVGYRITLRLSKTIDQSMVARTHEHGWSMHYLHRSDEHERRLEAANSADSWPLRAGAHGRRRPGQGHQRRRLQIRSAMSRHRDAAGSSFRPASRSRTISRSPTPIRWCISWSSTRRTRLLWGSDWPHPQYFKPMPNDVALLDMMLDWVPDEKIAQAHLRRQSSRIIRISSPVRNRCSAADRPLCRSCRKTRDGSGSKGKKHETQH